MVYGDEPQKTGEYKDSLGTSRYTYAPQTTAIMQAGKVYVYGLSNPVRYTDPTGKDAIAEWDTGTYGSGGMIWDPDALIALIFGFVKSTVNIVFSKGKSNPHDLEKGMSPRQREKFQREIEDYKDKNGMPPDYNLPWEILKKLSEDIKKMYK